MERRLVVAPSRVTPFYVAGGERITCQIPLPGALSKNAQHALRRGRMYLTADAEAARDAVRWALKMALQGRIFRPHQKVWLDIFVQRADLRSDPINVLDSMADAIKTIIGVDDRWFAVARLDWAVVREKAPFVQISVWQDADSPSL